MVLMRNGKSTLVCGNGFRFLSGFLVGSNGWGITFLLCGYASGGKCSTIMYLLRWYTLLVLTKRSHGAGGFSVDCIGGDEW